MNTIWAWLDERPWIWWVLIRAVSGVLLACLT